MRRREASFTLGERLITLRRHLPSHGENVDNSAQTGPRAHGRKEGVRVNVSSPAMCEVRVNVVNVPSLGPGPMGGEINVDQRCAECPPVMMRIINFNVQPRPYTGSRALSLSTRFTVGRC